MKNNEIFLEILKQELSIKTIDKAIKDLSEEFNLPDYEILETIIKNKLTKPSEANYEK